LQRLFLIEAAKYNVLPLDDRVVERVNPDMAGRPSLIRGNSQLMFDGMIGIQENCMLNLKNKSHSVTADVDVPERAGGVIVNEGGRTGGWTFYLKDGRPVYHYNFLGMQRFEVAGDASVPAGKHQLRMEFAYDGGGIGKGGTAALFVDGKQVGSAHIERTHAFNYALCETGGVGRNAGSPVCDDYPAADNAFTGKIDWVRLEVGSDSHDHMLDPVQKVNVAMTRQ
jgi:hypothetical protein